MCGAVKQTYRLVVMNADSTYRAGYIARGPVHRCYRERVKGLIFTDQASEADTFAGLGRAMRDVHARALAAIGPGWWPIRIDRVVPLGGGWTDWRESHRATLSDARDQAAAVLESIGFTPDEALRELDDIEALAGGVL